MTKKLVLFFMFLFISLAMVICADSSCNCNCNCNDLSHKSTLTFRVAVNYGESVNKLINLGAYDLKDPHITSKNFPTYQKKGRADVDIMFVYSEKFITYDQVMHLMDIENLRPATLPELLALGATYPDEQRKFHIVALGSVWQNSDSFRYSAFLDSDGSDRILGLDLLAFGWSKNSLFAVVRK